MYPVQSYKQAFCFRGDIIHFRPLVHAYYADMHVPDPMPDPIPGQIPILLAFFFLLICTTYLLIVEWVA